MLAGSPPPRVSFSTLNDDALMEAAFAAMIRHSDPHPRAQALRMLAVWPSGDLVAHCLEAFEDRSEAAHVRLAAANALIPFFLPDLLTRLASWGSSNLGSTAILGRCELHINMYLEAVTLDPLDRTIDRMLPELTQLDRRLGQDSGLVRETCVRATRIVNHRRLKPGY